MHIALQGFLAGVALAVFLFVFEYLSQKAAAKERGKKIARKPELNQDEKARILSMMRFCFFIPPGVAIIAWLVWG